MSGFPSLGAPVPTRSLFGIFLLTLSVLVVELSLTRLFSATMYYHFAFMAISLALFGSGASGVAVYLAQHRLDAARTGHWLALASMTFGITAVAALGVVLANPLDLEGGTGNYARLAVIYAVAALPFFAAGCAVTLAITRFAADISRLYLFDLAGAAAGCLMLIPLLDLAGAIDAILIAAALGAFAGVLFARTPGGRPVDLLVSAFGAGVLALLALWNVAAGVVEIRSAKGVSEENVLFSKWNSFSRITVSGSLASSFLLIQIDADAATRITRNAADPGLWPELRRSEKSLAYHLRPGGKTLIIGPGGGIDVMIARAFGARPITGVEVNPIIAEDVMSSEPFRSYSGAILQQPEVRLVVDEGRSFIRNSREHYDVIQATLVDTWAATAAGAFALTENNLYTVEAFKDYAAHLAPGGILTMTRWYLEPPDQLLRLLALTRAMMAETGIRSPEAHVMLVRGAGSDEDRLPATYLFKGSPFTSEEVRLVEALAREHGFEILYTPLTRPPNLFTAMMEAPDPESVWRSFETDVAPTRDDNPFFFNSVRLSNLTRALRGGEEWRKTNLAMLVLVALLVITSVLVVVFILGPLALARRRALAAGLSTRLAYLGYFACLGAGFIIVEIVLIQKFILFLGHPVYALAVVLFSILVFSALGSHLSARVPPQDPTRALGMILVGLVAAAACYAIALPPIFYRLAGLARPIRIGITVVLIAPLAVLMGIPMPAGIRALARRLPEVVPWAWGVNGAASVMGSVAALVVGILAGFNRALLAGAALYLAAAVLFTAAWRRTAIESAGPAGEPAGGGGTRAIGP